MQHRQLGVSDLQISTVSMGCWAIGGAWGKVSEKESLATLHAAVDSGVNFFDTADVYGDGRSERLVGQLLRERGETLYVATKAGRRLSPHVADGYTKENLDAFVGRSLKNLGLERVDLLQLHCPPTEVYYQPEVFHALEQLRIEGKIRYFGVSVERVEEGLKALEYPGLRCIQIIYNLFRQRPAERLIQTAKEKGVGVLARVPLASGLLTGKMNAGSEFPEDDHRHFNREGKAFDVGETFAGVPFEVGLAAVQRLQEFVPPGVTLAQMALRWILENPGISAAIPGAKSAEQASQNSRAADLPALDASTLAELDAIYRELIAPHVHQRW